MDLTTATPVEIDTALADAYEKIANLTAARMRAEQGIARIDEIEPGSYNSRLPQYSPASRAKLVEEAKRLRHEIGVVYEVEVGPLDTEYYRRGTWPRYYLVDNAGGHVHPDQHCTTCFPSTKYAWLVEQSGMSAEDLVKMAGEDACTVCFDWAPVSVLQQKSRLEAPERKKARLEREAKKAAQEAAKAAKGITTPEGGKLYRGKDNDSWDVCKTLRVAEIAATDALADLLLEQRTSKDPEQAWIYEAGRMTTEQKQHRITRHAWCLIRSIAHKKGQTFEETFQVHEKKAQAKLRKWEREWAKDFRVPPTRIK